MRLYTRWSAGSGKSEFIKILKEKHNQKSFSIINGDDLRNYHPFYTQFLIEDEENAADLTQESVNYWVERLINEVSNRKGDIIIEGTMKNPNVPINTAKLLKEKNYSVEANIILTNQEISKVDMIRRYLVQKQSFGSSRFTKPEAHKNILKNILESIIKINQSEFFDNVKIYRRIAVEYKKIFEKNLFDNVNNLNIIEIIESEMKENSYLSEI